MSFFENLVRYPIFFFSSMLGLISIIISPFLRLLKELPNKTFINFTIFFIFGAILLILKQMLNLD